MTAQPGDTSSHNFLWRLNRWVLLRAPLFWRTRLLNLLALMTLTVIAMYWFEQRSIQDPGEITRLAAETVSNWQLRLYWAIGVLLIWIILIIRKPVGELPPLRHIVTVVAVTIGSYLLLVTPGLLAYPQINAIKRLDPGNQILDSDSATLSRYSYWNCVPAQVWGNNNSEREQLRDLLARYGIKVDLEADLKKEPSSSSSGCKADDQFRVRDTLSLSYARDTISVIRDARSFASNSYYDSYFSYRRNQFYGIAIGHLWWPAAALGIGILTALWSYPWYVWRRTFSAVTGFGN